jgi:hypothetical protein
MPSRRMNHSSSPNNRLWLTSTMYGVPRPIAAPMTDVSPPARTTAAVA